MRNTGGEIVQVQGGHIIRSTAKKDRHSKVYTAKGPRDRRVRLAAHTAIKFYDVQDRLGYDRPSKAVDWLIKKAKSAIDKLDELPPWNPVLPDADVNVGCSMERVAMETQQQSDSSGYGMSMNVNNESHFTPTSLESFFPTTSASLSLNLQNYPNNMMSNSENKPQDLCLSLHSYQDPTRGHQTDQNLFVEPGSGTWADQQQGEMGRFSRMMGWSEESRGGFMFNNPPVYGSGQDGSDFSQRGTLQSSFVNSVHAWDNHDTHEIHRNSVTDDHRFVPEGFSGFCVPPRGYGNGELDNRHSSDSPHSHH